jgi:hypothetical protein
VQVQDICLLSEGVVLHDSLEADQSSKRPFRLKKWLRRRDGVRHLAGPFGLQDCLDQFDARPFLCEEALCQDTLPRLDIDGVSSHQQNPAR